MSVDGTGTTGVPGKEYAGAWLAFDSDRADFNRDIYMMRPDGSALTRLTWDTSIEKEPAFAPPGNRVGYMDNRIAFASNRAGMFQIYVMNLATNEVARLTDRAEGADQPSFSRDGTRVAFHSGPSVYIVSADGTGESLVATGLDTFNAYFSPQFSLDDQELVFDRNNEIDAVHLDGSGLRMIVRNWTTSIKAPTVAPNGLEIAYHVYCDTGLSIWTTPFSTTTNPCAGRRVTPTGDADSQHAAWGPKNLLAYERVNKATNAATIMVISREAGSLPVVLTPDLSDNRNPAWSP